ncbi:MAG: acylphosphatase [Gemmatimonadota bacterium]|nr:acylphosphatase [Gemmatimonadota bacterium]
MRLRLEVHGRVQGVGFRWFVREAARRRGVAGWVRNRGDGSVELEVSGTEPSLRELIAAIREGPPGARVDDVREANSGATDELPRPFTIMR